MPLDRPVVWGLLVLGMVGCGPDIVPATNGSGAGSGTGTGGTAGSATSTGGPSSGAHDGPVSTSSPADGTTGSSTTGDGAESSTTDAFTCGCPDDTPIDFETELRAGFTPADALAVFQGLALPLEWTAYEGNPETVLHIDAAYVGGAVVEGPGGTDGCLFLSVPCTEGVSMEVQLTLLTDDGALDMTVPALLMGTPDGNIEVTTDRSDIGGNAGTLASWPLLVRGRPFVIAELRVGASRLFEFWLPSVEGWSAEGDSVLLGDEA
jgi:hypothetical protein